MALAGLGVLLSVVPDSDLYASFWFLSPFSGGCWGAGVRVGRSAFRFRPLPVRGCFGLSISMRSLAWIREGKVKGTVNNYSKRLRSPEETLSLA